MDSRIYGWVRDLPQAKPMRTLKYNIAPGAKPPHVDYRDNRWCPPVYDQKRLGSCTAQAGAGGVHINALITDYKWPYTPSRMFIYYNTRKLEHHTFIDSGATISGTVEAINKYGVCPEEGNPAWSWGYSDDALHFRTKPKDACYKDAVLHRALSYQAVHLHRNDIQDSVFSKVPVLIGVSVYESFETAEVAKTGHVPVPNPGAEKLLGGHAMLIVGYDQESDVAIVRNSWGEGWGDKGYCYIPFEYLCNPDLAADFAAIELVGYSK